MIEFKTFKLKTYLQLYTFFIIHNYDDEGE